MKAHLGGSHPLLREGALTTAVTAPPGAPWGGDAGHVGDLSEMPSEPILNR